MTDTETKGRIFDIQRYSIHDGRGIRTIVFFKGCVLRCRWCCNPESQRYETETMRTQDGVKTMGRDVTVGEVLDIVERDRGYYRRSNGGLTLSGGEFLCQPAFALSLLREAKAHGISTAVESMGCADWDTVRSVLPYIDQYLMDIKHTDGEKHRLFTGKSNELMLENARKIAESGLTELTVRVPVIPTFNATEAEIAAIARFADSLPGVKALHLLPYHRLGQDKYAGLGREYTMADILPPSGEAMNALLRAARENCKLHCQIGG